MGKHSLAVVVTIAFSVVGVAGDYLLDFASGHRIRSSIAVVLRRVLRVRLDGVRVGLRDEALQTGHHRRGLLGVDGAPPDGRGCRGVPGTAQRIEVAGLIMAVASLVLLMRFG